MAWILDQTIPHTAFRQIKKPGDCSIDPGPLRTTLPPPWQAATSPRPVRWMTSASWASAAISCGVNPRLLHRLTAVRVASRAAAERPNPAPIGRRHSVVTETVTPSFLRTYSSSGEVLGIEDTVSGFILAVHRDGHGIRRGDRCRDAFADHDTGPDTSRSGGRFPFNSPEIPGDMTRAECSDRPVFMGIGKYDV